MSAVHISKLLDYEKDDDEIDDVSSHVWDKIESIIPSETELQDQDAQFVQHMSTPSVLAWDESSLDHQQAILRTYTEQNTKITDQGIDIDNISVQPPNPDLANIPKAIFGTDEMKAAIIKLCLEFAIIFSRSVKTEPAEVPTFKMKLNEKL